MSVTVLSIAFTFAPVSRDAVGGAEQILSDLDQALAAAGQISLVVACEGSRTAGRLFSAPLPAGGTFSEAEKIRCRKSFQCAIDHALHSHAVDLIHMHGLDFCEYSLPPGIPVLVSLHMPAAFYPPETWQRCARQIKFCFVSESQRQSFPVHLRDHPVIANGVVPAPSMRRKKEDFAMVMGRICAEKNAHAALQAGTLAATRVLLAGQIFPYKEHQQYFAEKVRPLLQDGVQHAFLGPVTSPARQQLLAQAKCLLHPTLAPETSSLVAMEALAAGTPVIAYPSGALKDIVADGKTGFLVNSVEEMVEAMRRVHTLSPEACRREAEQRFSKSRMVQQYFDLYTSLVRQEVSEQRCA